MLIRIMNESGDTPITLDPSSPTDRERAQRMIENARAEGKLVFAVDGKGCNRQLEELDVKAPEIIIAPRAVGG